MKCVRQQANLIFFFKQKTAYELRISDWSSDVCSSDLAVRITRRTRSARAESKHWKIALCSESAGSSVAPWRTAASITSAPAETSGSLLASTTVPPCSSAAITGRSEEHTSELQSLMRISYAVFCLKKKTKKQYKTHTTRYLSYENT